MNRILTSALVAAGLLLVGDAGHAAPASQCTPGTIDTTIAEGFGSVGFVANLRSNSGSIRATARDLLGEALARRTSDPDHCAAGCASGARTIIYKVLPTAYLNQDRQRPECLQFERETTAAPLNFDRREFASLDDMNDWIMKFSRGKGDDGKALYEACSSNCSPRYTFLIEPLPGDRLALAAEVVCGLARDKKVKQYSLSTALRSQCSAAAVPLAGGGHGE